MMPRVIFQGLLLLPALAYAARYTSAEELASPEMYSVPCGPLWSGEGQPRFAGCTPSTGDECPRIVEDNFLTEEEADQLIAIVEKGFAFSTATAGPAILDIHSGYLRDASLQNLYEKLLLNYTREELQVYAGVFAKLRHKLMDIFKLERLYFTAPTFVSRIIGGGVTWEPATEHDRYWEPHVDRRYAPQYAYSGLIYLSTYANVDSTGELKPNEFTGGRLNFLSAQDGSLEHSVQPRKGRLLAFTSGEENPHAVEKVLAGTRYVLSCWFSCDPRAEFLGFLGPAAADGKLQLVGDDAEDKEAEEQQPTETPTPRKRSTRNNIETSKGEEL